MLKQIQEKLVEFFNDPLGTAIEWAMYLVMLGIGIAILVWAVRFAVSFIW